MPPSLEERRPAITPQLAVRVVSMPSTNVFEAQDAAYRESVLPRAVQRRVRFLVLIGALAAALPVC